MRYLFLLLIFCSCSQRYYSPDVYEIVGHETHACSYHGDEPYFLSRGFPKEELIGYLEACKYPKYKRGDIVFYLDNSNCSFQVRYAEVYSPSKKHKNIPDDVVYVGDLNCNGLISDHDYKLQSQLFKKKPKH